jgi:glutamate carboxypeptidase
MQSLASNERSALDMIDQDRMLGQVQQWAAINSGSGNLKGLAETAGMLADAFAALPGNVDRWKKFVRTALSNIVSTVGIWL